MALSFLIHDLDVFRRYVLKQEQHGERVEVNGLTTRTHSWWRYNPILQKPRSLDPVRPWSWFWYYGPDPAAGVSYGQFHDSKNKFDIVTEKPEAPSVVYSPATGDPMDFVADVSYGELQDLLSKTTSHAIDHTAVCGSCELDLMSDFDLGLPDDLFCPKCAEKVTVSSPDNSNQQEKKTMANVKRSAVASKAKRVESLKTRIRASVIKKRKAEAAKVAAKKAPSKVKLTPRQLRQRALARKRRAQAADVNEMISLDTIMEAMDQEEEEEAVEDEALCGEEKMEEESFMEEEGLEEEVAEASDDEDLEGLDEVMMEEEVEEMPIEDEVMMEEEEEVEEEAFMEEEVEEEAFMEDDIIEEVAEEEAVEEAAESDEGSDDEYMDLDMVVSMIQRKEKLAKAKRKNKIKALANKKAVAKKKALLAKKKKALAEEEGEDEDDAGQAGGAGDEPDAGDPNDAPVDVIEDELAETGDTAPEPDMVSEENPAADDEVDAAEAMRFEPLASVSDLQDTAKEDIDLSLYGEDTDNPVWNVTVAGIPTARIQLKTQDYPDEIRAAFCSDDYAKNIIIHCEKTGFTKTMQNVKAEFWANRTSDAKIAARYKAQAENKFGSERKKLVATFRDNYRNCINIVQAGMSKNFFPELGNPLKDSLFTNLKTVGLPEQTAISAIEKSFTESAADYFEALFNKSEDYLDKHPEARKEIATAIANGSTLNHTSAHVEPEQAGSLSDRVAQASVIPAANNGSVATAGFKVSKDLVMDTENYKDQLRSVMKNN